MELISGFLFIVVIGVISYVFTRKDNKENKIEQLDTDKEMKLRKQILEHIDYFLTDASYYEHIGNWDKNKVYKYICNKGRVYEFVDFMSENNQEIGIDDEKLCFKRMTYKRNDSAVINVVS